MARANGTCDSKGRRFEARTFQFHTTSLDNMCLCQGAAMPCDWEGNRGSGVALAMRHSFQWSIPHASRGLTKKDEHPV